MKKIAGIFNTTVFLMVAAFLVPLIGASSARAGSQTAAQEMSDAVEVLCPKLAALNKENPFGESSPVNDVLLRCGEVKIGKDFPDQQSFNDLTPDQKLALGNMTPDETTSMKTMSVEITQAQMATVIGRLEALRGGTPSHLALNSTGSGTSPALYAGPVTYLASADDKGGYEIRNNGKLGMYVNGNWGTGNKDASRLEPGFNYDTWAVTMGADYRFTSAFVLGGAVGYSRVNADLDHSAGNTESKGYAFSLYSLYYLGDFYLDAIGSIGTRDVDTERTLSYAVTVPVNQRFHGSTNAKDYDVSLGAGYDFRTGGLTIGPYAQLRYFKTKIDGYSEHLSGSDANPGFGMAMGIDAQNIESVTSTLGGQVSYAHSTGIGILQPYLRLGWIHEFSNNARVIKAHFINVPDDPAVAALNHILINTSSPDENYFDLAVGFSMVFPRGIQAFLGYQTVLGLQDITSHLVSAGIRLEI
jgi:outer membrane lipase/esterase